MKQKKTLTPYIFKSTRHKEQWQDQETKAKTTTRITDLGDDGSVLTMHPHIELDVVLPACDLLLGRQRQVDPWACWSVHLADPVSSRFSETQCKTQKNLPHTESFSPHKYTCKTLKPNQTIKNHGYLSISKNDFIGDITKCSHDFPQPGSYVDRRDGEDSS